MDWTQILTALAVAIPPTVAALAALLKIHALKVEINSRMTELLKATKTLGYNEGVIQGHADAKNRH